MNQVAFDVMGTVVSSMSINYRKNWCLNIVIYHQIVTGQISVFHVRSVPSLSHNSNIKSLYLESLGSHLNHISRLQCKVFSLVKPIKGTRNIFCILIIIDYSSNVKVGVYIFHYNMHSLQVFYLEIRFIFWDQICRDHHKWVILSNVIGSLVPLSENKGDTSFQRISRVLIRKCWHSRIFN